MQSTLPAPKILTKHSMFKTREFQAWFSSFYFTLEKCVQCGLPWQRMRVERRDFYLKISQRSCYVQHCTCTQKYAMHSMFNVKEFQACFSTFYFTLEICVKCAFALNRMRVERRVFYPKIIQRSCYVLHCSCTQKVAIHCIFNIKEFQAWFSTLYYAFSKCIFHGNGAYSVGLHCRLCA